MKKTSEPINSGVKNKNKVEIMSEHNSAKWAKHGNDLSNANSFLKWKNGKKEIGHSNLNNGLTTTNLQDHYGNLVKKNNESKPA